MSLKNQKGIVRYQGRDDIVCSYGVRDDGMQFYYLDTEGAVFKNGNRIATTALVEAVDPMVKASNVGVLDGDGNEVIPFTNRSVRPVNDDIILVEPATPTSESVNEAIKMKSDPLSATKLVSTPALIKDKLNAQVGNDGRYLFNDQFSEATVCDINGNNLVNGESYSFIVSDGNNLYFSKNTADSEITNYSILPPEVQSNVTPAGDSQELNVSAVDVSKEDVEQALNGQTEEKEEVAEEQANDVEISEPDDSSVQENTEVVEEEETVESDNSSELIDDAVQDTNLETGFEIPTVAVDAPSLPESVIPAVAEEKPVEEAVTEEVVEAPVDETVAEEVVEAPVEENVTEEVVEAPVDETVAEEVVEASVEETVTEEVVEAPVKETVAEEVVEAPVKETVAEEVVEAPVEEAVTEEVVEAPVEDTVVAEAPVEEPTDVQLNEDILTTNQNIVEDNTEVDALSDFLNQPVEEKVEDSDITEENISSDVSETSLQDIDTPVEDTVSEDISLDDVDDIFANSNIQIDHIDNDFMDNIDGEDKAATSKDNIMADVAKSMTAMINRIRILEAELSEERARSDKLNSARRTLIEKNQILGKRADAYKNKASSLGAVVAQTNSKNSLLENRVHEQKRVIEAQSQELQVLRPLLKGKEEVVGILADVQALLDQNAA